LQTNASDGYVPDLPSAPRLDLIDNLPELNALGEPALHSLGLASWYPAGRVQAMLEMFHVNFDLPWFACIAGAAFALRILIMPLYIMNRKNIVHLRNHSTELKRLEKRYKDAKATGNQTLGNKYTLMHY